jgi:hypothetical protein
VDGRLCASQATLAAARASQTAFTACTTAPLRNGSVLQRCYRDLQGAASHFLTGDQSMIDTGAVLAAAPGAAIVF